MTRLRSVAMLMILAGCSNPRATKIPADLAEIGKIQSSLIKLDTADRRRVATYEMRAHLGSIFGQAAPPAGVTIGEAIDNQKAFEADAAKRDAQERADSTKAAAARSAQVATLQRVVTATVGARSEQETSLGKMIGYDLVLRNASTKAIDGVKGDASFLDVFGKEISSVTFDFERPIAPGESVTAPRQLLVSLMDPGFAKIDEIPAAKLRINVEPTGVAFSDGTQLSVADRP